ncbi:hypothetical protein AB4305_21345 [Nocardia sp. 2YAB30]|uniref:hypothetical protein n=1 Tax=unclassified Nocardia TaxID=2637762 RepID=UPI003F95F729
MHKKVENALRQDFERWAELVDRAAHGENEVEREKPALAAAALKMQWIRAAAEDWRALHEQWCERIYPTQSGVKSEIPSQIAESNCVCEQSGPRQARAVVYK